MRELIKFLTLRQTYQPAHTIMEYYMLVLRPIWQVNSTYQMTIHHSIIKYLFAFASANHGEDGEGFLCHIFNLGGL